MDTLDNANTTTNPFVVNSNNPDILAQKEGFVLNLADGFKQNGTEKSPSSELDFLSRPTNGKRSADEFDDDDDDLGPETDVDAVDDILLSPAIAAAKSLAEGIINNNPTNIFDPFCEKEEKATLETDSELQKQQTSEFDSIKSPREETPTPPADSGECLCFCILLFIILLKCLVYIEVVYNKSILGYYCMRRSWDLQTG